MQRKQAVALGAALVHPRARGVEVTRAARLAGWLLLVGLASVLPFLSALPGYFLGDDFGVVQLLADKPPLHVLTLFTTPWTEQVYGHALDELRPTVALAFQFSALWGASAPLAYHLTALALHVATTLLVFALARHVARLGLPAATFAAVLFAVLPAHAETVVWLQGLSDSVPAAFYLATVLPYALWRRCERRALYGLACGLCFLALFSKQSAITLPALLVAYDVLVERRWPGARWRAWRGYLPFVLLTLGYLGLRYALFGQAVREERLALGLLGYFVEVQFVAVQMLPLGSTLPYSDAAAPGLRQAAMVAAPPLALAGVLLVVWAAQYDWRRGGSGEGPSMAGLLLFFGPAWWLLTTLPLVMTYHAPRHLYLAAAGVAVALAVGCQWLRDQPHPRLRTASMPAAAVLVLGAALALQRPLAEWRQAMQLSQQIHQEVQREALAAPPGSLLVLGAPAIATPAGGWRDVVWVWAWAMPYAVRPPFAATDLAGRVRFVYARRLDCCADADAGERWFAAMRAHLADWVADQASAPAIVLYWSASNGALTRRTTDEPGLREQLGALAASRTPGELAAGLDVIAPQRDW